MDLSIYTSNTNHDNPPGPRVTMDPTSYIPTTADPTVPLPPGLQVSTIEASITTIHPIHTTNPLIIEDFPNNDAGAVLFHAFTRIEEFFSHGFTINDAEKPERDVWLTATCQTLVNIHNSIRRTNLISPLPNSFNHLSTEEFELLQLLKRTLSSLNSFFTNHLTNPDTSQVCLRCLEECNIPVTADVLGSILMSCDQNVRAVHSTIVNDVIRNMSNNLTIWAETRTAEIRDKLINALVNEAVDQKILDEDERVQAWANSNLEFIRTRLHNIIRKQAGEPDTFTHAWISEAADAAFMQAARSSTAQAEAAASKHYDDEMARLMGEANERIANDLATAKAEAESAAQAVLTAFKHTLKIETERRKDNATKVADAAVRKASRTHPHAPMISTSNSRRSTTNQGGDTRPSRTPSRSSSALPSRDPSPVRAASTTPKASPATFLPTSQALTEPLTDISVGPPSNSFEERMFDFVSMVDGPSNQTVAPPDDNMSVPSIPTPVAAQAVAHVTTPIPDGFANFFAQISSQISSLSSQFQHVESRLSNLEQPKAYTPSAIAPKWAEYNVDTSPPDFPDDTSDYCPPIAFQMQTEEHDRVDLFLERIYRKHYNIQDRVLPSIHNHILRSEFHSSFDLWMEFFGITSDVADITNKQINTFLSWRLKYIDIMADTPSDLQDIWICKRDDIRTATGIAVGDTTKFGPGLSGSPTSGAETEPPSANTGEAGVGGGNTDRLTPLAHNLPMAGSTLGKGARSNPTPPSPLNPRCKRLNKHNRGKHPPQLSLPAQAHSSPAPN